MDDPYRAPRADDPGTGHGPGVVPPPFPGDTPPTPTLLPQPFPATSRVEVLAALYDFALKAGPDDLIVLRQAQVTAILAALGDVRQANHAAFVAEAERTNRPE